MHYDSNGGSFGAVIRPVRTHPDWPANPYAVELAGPVILDVYNRLAAIDHPDKSFLPSLVETTIRAGKLFSDWSEADELKFKTAVWKSAHRWLLENIALIERDQETKEIAKALGVDL